jgi:general secretion pathway protein G
VLAGLPDKRLFIMKTLDPHHMRSGLLKAMSSGMTLVEVIIVIAILVILASISSIVYVDYVNRAKMYTAIDTITAMSTEICSYGMDTGVYPQSLAEMGYGSLLDPWGNPYEYLNIRNAVPGVSGMRKDKFLVPINTDFDLYSKGVNGQSTTALNTAQSKDDIIRANDGQYIGLAGGF